MAFESICEKCEEVLQPYLDRDLDEAERQEAEAHLADCGYCRKRYRFEESLRRFVRQACSEEMPPELKAKLASLRTPLV
jgi:mycothiol system anti-sigma-R factor